MFLRKYKFFSVALLAALAFVAGPARSEAGTQILIQELDATNTVIASQSFTGTSATLTTADFTSITVTTSTSTGAVSSLTSTVNAVPTTAFDANPVNSLRIVVTTDGFTNPYGTLSSASVLNNAAASSGIGGGTNTLSNQTQLLDSTSTLIAGSATSAAADTRPGGGASPTTTANVSNMPDTFAIQQTILVNATPTDAAAGIASGSTLGGSASSVVQLTPAPAPGGLILALAAVPAFGLRRLVRKQK